MDTKALRQKILDLAIRGKLVPQDPNDEPASVLLERIRAEKQQMVKDGKLKAKDIKNDTVIFKGDDNLHYEQFADGTVKCIEDEIPFELPNGWIWCRLKDLFNVCSAKRVLQSEWQKEGVPFYRAREIVKLSNNGFVDNELFISLEHYETLKQSYGVPQVGDLMVTGVGTIGKVYIVKENDIFYYKDASVLCFENRYGTIISEFARIMIESPLLQEQIHSKTYGNTVDTITITTANEYLCALPPLPEQRKIIDRINIVSNVLTEIDNHIDKLSIDISNVKSKILDLAIRGKLVPQDPNDEPASVLLERIRAEKEELIKQGKIKRDKKESVIFKGDDNSYYEKYGEKLPSGWVVTNFETLLEYEQPTKYIVNDTNYKPTYKTPVLTAGKSFILGYTNETDNIFDDLPVIIFDDFTTESKFVDFPFKVKSSAMKILHANQDLVLPKYAFYLMQATEIDHENHQRYWISTYSQEIVALPPIMEQERILTTLEHYFNLLDTLH